MLGRSVGQSIVGRGLSRRRRSLTGHGCFLSTSAEHSIKAIPGRLGVPPLMEKDSNGTMQTMGDQRAGQHGVEVDGE